MIVYDISFARAAHHEAEVKATFTALPPGPVNFRMARSSTGRYALTEYAKNVYSVKAVDGTGKELPLTHPDPYSWTVTRHTGTVTLTYTDYANVGSGTFSGFNLDDEHVQPQSVFVYVKGLEARPIKVTFHRPDPTWTIATQLVPTSDPETFTAPGMQYFFDSPVHLGNIQWREWTETHDGVKQTWRVALDDPTGPQAIDAYADGAKKIIHEAGAVYGEFPKFDFGTYTFVACYRADCQSDGMEHRNSTSVTGGSFGGIGNAGLSTGAHEYFHSWNVKRIRPQGLDPWDYDRANMTDGLWIAEGFTQYYGPLLEERAGVTEPAATIRGLGNLINSIAAAPGRLFYGPIGMSNQAPFRDGAAAPDPLRPNIFISFYSYGGAIAVALDFSLRARGKSLDDYMRQMWLNHGKPEITYSMHDARHALIQVSGDSAWAVDLWTRYVEGHELPDYPKLLDAAGIIVQKAAPGQPWVGGSLGAGGGGGRGNRGGGGGRGAAPAADPNAPDAARVASAPANTPLYDAGLDAGDVITTADGKPIATAADFTAMVATHKPGDKIAVAYTSIAGPRNTTLTIGESPALQVQTYEQAGKTPSAAQLAFRTKWLAPKAQPAHDMDLHLIDAFAKGPFTGNPAAVVLLPDIRPDAWMQAVAMEMNQAETAFLVRKQDDGFSLRWFTPLAEVDLCGHATLASAHYLWGEDHLEEGTPARFHTRSGLLTARRNADNSITLDFPGIQSKPVTPPADLEAALGQKPVAVLRGSFDLLCVLRDAAQVRTLTPDLAAIARWDARGVLVTAPGDVEGIDFVSRCFFPALGVPEDPVTGSAHCALAPYWRDALELNEMVGEQASTRGGIIRLTVVDDRVHLTGKAVTTMRGRLEA